MDEIGFFTVTTETGKAVIKASAVTAVLENTADNTSSIQLQGTYIGTTEQADTVIERWHAALRTNLKDQRE